VINNGRVLYSGPVEGLRPQGRVIVKFEVSDGAEKLESRLKTVDWAISFRRAGRRFTVAVRSRRDACVSLVKLISEAGTPLESFQVSGVDLESTLLHLLRGGRDEQA